MNSNSKATPPIGIDKILKWRLPEDQFEEIQGDLHELYDLWVQEYGKRKARRLYLINAVSFFRPLPKRKSSPYQKSTSNQNSIFMNLNYLKLAFRNLQRSKANSVINMAGLALGMACCIMIFLVARHELSYDVFHKNIDRIYRVNTKFITTGGFTGGAPMPMADAMEEYFPEVEKATRTIFVDEGLIKVEEQLYKEKGIGYLEPDYFSIFDSQWIAGNPEKSLSDPSSVVLSERMAQKYFGGSAENIAQAALGKTIRFNNDFLHTVTGIVENFPPNTDLPFEIIFPANSLLIHNPNWDLTSWINITGSVNHFALLKDGASHDQLAEKLPEFEVKHMGELEASRRTHLLQPLSEMHFDSRFGNYNGRTIDKANIKGLVLIGVFILVIACINFINQATAQAVKRAKEVGVRKVLGANRPQLVKQFLSEAGVLGVFSLLAAIVLAYVLVPQLKALLNLNFEFNPFKDPDLIVYLIALTAITILLSGIYPALFLSGYNPIMALKNKIMGSRKGAFTLRRSLIVVQFAIAQILIISTLIISSQLEYFRNKPLGFDKEAIVTIVFPPGNKAETRNALRTQLEQTPGIESVSYAIFTPSDESSWWSPITFPGSDPNIEYYVQRIPIDHTYLETFNLPLVAGENLSISNDTTGVLINETLVKKMDIPDAESAIGRTFKLVDKEMEIRGVVKDFHTGSLKGDIGSVVMEKMPHSRIAGIKLEPDKIRPTMARIEQLWKTTYPESYFEYEFLDEAIASFYTEEVKMFKLFGAFSGIAIFISCLGLYGLVSFMAVQKTKEIGIRKVLGASLASILSLFTKEFFILIIIAFVVAAPLAYYAMNEWLKDFEYKLPLGIDSFLIAIIFSLLIAGLTVIYKSLWAALSNPVKSLRSE